MNIREFLKNVVTDDININVKHNALEDGIVVRTKAYGKKPKQTWISNELIFDDNIGDEQFKGYLIESLNNLTK